MENRDFDQNENLPKPQSMKKADNKYNLLMLGGAVLGLIVGNIVAGPIGDIANIAAIILAGLYFYQTFKYRKSTKAK